MKIINWNSMIGKSCVCSEDLEYLDLFGNIKSLKSGMRLTVFKTMSETVVLRSENKMFYVDKNMVKAN